MNNQQQLKINAENFAYHFMDSINRNDIKKDNMEEAAKEALASYLTAYYLATRFNNLENKFFDEKHLHKVSAYQKILQELNQY